MKYIQVTELVSDQVGKADDRAYVLNHYARLILSVGNGLKKTKMGGQSVSLINRILITS